MQYLACVVLAGCGGDAAVTQLQSTVAEHSQRIADNTTKNVNRSETLQRLGEQVTNLKKDHGELQKAFSRVIARDTQKTEESAQRIAALERQIGILKSELAEAKKLTRPLTAIKSPVEQTSDEPAIETKMARSYSGKNDQVRCFVAGTVGKERLLEIATKLHKESGRDLSVAFFSADVSPAFKELDFRTAIWATHSKFLGHWSILRGTWQFIEPVR